MNANVLTVLVAACGIAVGFLWFWWDERRRLAYLVSDEYRIKYLRIIGAESGPEDPGWYIYTDTMNPAERFLLDEGFAEWASAPVNRFPNSKSSAPSSHVKLTEKGRAWLEEVGTEA